MATTSEWTSWVTAQTVADPSSGSTLESDWTSWVTAQTVADTSDTAQASAWTVWREVQLPDTPVNEWWIAGAGGWVRAELVSLE